MSEFDKALAKYGEYGEITQVKHPIVIMDGLPSVRIHEMIAFENGVLGEVMSIARKEVQAAVFSDQPLKTGTKAAPLKKFLSVPVGEELIGQTIDPLGNALSGNASYKKPKEEREVDILPGSLDKRAKINRPLVTGISVIDLMVSLGKGQKELVVGDRKVGKSDFLLTVMDAQARLGSVVIYAAIAKQRSDIKKVQRELKDKGILSKAIIVATVPQNSAGLIFMTPYSAMTIAEYFMDRGRDVLVVLDDLSTHAKFYREVSLIAKKFPGRDSFPGDIFYIHARLLERAGNFKTGNSIERAISILPVVETVEGDFTAFIPTNLMGITDGHIFFDSDIYHSRRPAVNITLSVTRVGRQAQPPLIREISHELMVFFNKYEQLENLSHFGAELNDEVKNILHQGEMLNEFFRQSPGVAVPLEVQVICFGMIWLHFIEKAEEIIVLRDALSGHLAKDKFICGGLSSPDLNTLLEWTKNNKERILKYAK